MFNVVEITKESCSHLEKPKRFIFGGVIDESTEPTLHKRLFGNSPNCFVRDKSDSNVWTKRKIDAAIEYQRKTSRLWLKQTSCEKTIIRSTIAESIDDVGIYPVQVNFEYPNGGQVSLHVTKA